GFAVDPDYPYLRATHSTGCVRKAPAIRRKSSAILTGRGAGDLLRFAARSRNQPKMRLSRVLREVHIDRREHHPAPIWRYLRIADALQRHHVFESEGTLLS